MSNQVAIETTVMGIPVKTYEENYSDIGYLEKDLFFQHSSGRELRTFRVERTDDHEEFETYRVTFIRSFIGNDECDYYCSSIVYVICHDAFVDGDKEAPLKADSSSSDDFLIYPKEYAKILYVLY